MFLHFLDEAAAERKCQSINLSTTTTTVGGEQQGNTTHAREHKGKQTHEKKGANGHKHTETTTKKRNKKPRQNVRVSNASLLCMHASVESSEPSKQVNAGCRHTFIQLDTFFSANERTCTYHALPYNYIVCWLVGWLVGWLVSWYVGMAGWLSQKRLPAANNVVEFVLSLVWLVANRWFVVDRSSVNWWCCHVCLRHVL